MGVVLMSVRGVGVLTLNSSGHRSSTGQADFRNVIYILQAYIYVQYQ